MGHLYHVTMYSLLGSIEDHGLTPGRARGIGGGSYDAHRKGAIFLTEAGGVHFWASRAEEWAQQRSDDLLEDGLVPVLLRVPDSVLRSCEDDEHGSRDARHDAYKCTTAIDPDDIEVWVGVDDEGEWLPIDDWGDIPIGDAFEEDSDGDETWHYLRMGGNGSPLVPHVRESNPAPRRRRRRRARRNPMRSPPPGFLEGSRVRGVVYHGTDRDPGTGHALSPTGGSEHGIYLSPRRQYAARYGRRMALAFVNLRSPIIVDDKSEISPRDLTRSDVAKLKRMGYDGIIVKAPRGPHQEMVAFDKRQVWVTEVR